MIGYCKHYRKHVITEGECEFCPIGERNDCKYFTEENPSLIVMCRKCEHIVYVEKWERAEKIDSMNEYDCPSCGEDGDENWIIVGIGFYEDM